MWGKNTSQRCSAEPTSPFTYHRMLFWCQPANKKWISALWCSRWYQPLGGCAAQLLVRGAPLPKFLHDELCRLETFLHPLHHAAPPSGAACLWTRGTREHFQRRKCVGIVATVRVGAPCGRAQRATSLGTETQKKAGWVANLEIRNFKISKFFCFGGSAAHRRSFWGLEHPPPVSAFRG